MLYLFAVFDVEIESPSKTFDNIEKKEDLKHDHDEAREAIFQWKAHIIRTKNKSKTEFTHIPPKKSLSYCHGLGHKVHPTEIEKSSLSGSEREE